MKLSTLNTIAGVAFLVSATAAFVSHNNALGCAALAVAFAFIGLATAARLRKK